MSTSTSSPTARPAEPPAEPPQMQGLDVALSVGLALADHFGRWWAGARWTARTVAAAALGVAGFVLLLTVWSVLRLLSWLITGAVGLIGDLAGHGWDIVATAHLTHMVTDPLTVSAGMLEPTHPTTPLMVGAVAGVLLWGASVAGVRGARIGWAVWGAAAVTAVIVGTVGAGDPDPSIDGQLLNAALASIAWAVLSIPAYWRHNTNPEVVMVPPSSRLLGRGGRDLVVVLPARTPTGRPSDPRCGGGESDADGDSH